MIRAEGNVEVWTTGDGMFLYFENGILVKVDQGQLRQQRVQVEVIKK